MEFEFDKEIDSLLRRTAARGGETVFDERNPQSATQDPKSFHPDADEISLFAEQGLSVKARARVTEHLADCRRCRKILSHLISINSEAESENVHAREIVAGSVSVPWYRKLFAFPQMAYAVGALALVFSGIIALMVLQNARESQNASVAQIEEMQEKPQGAKGMSSDGDASGTYSVSNTTTTTAAATNTTSNSTVSMANANSAYPMSRPVTPGSTANSNASILLDEKQLSVAGRDIRPEATIAPPPAPVPAAPKDKMAELAKKEDFVTDGPLPRQKRENESRADSVDALKSARVQSETSQNTMVQNLPQVVPDARNVQRSAPSSNRAQSAAGKSTVASDADSAAGESKNKVAAKKASGPRAAGGKTFNYANGVWYDSDYRDQPLTTVRRGTEDFKKLDADLRSIAGKVGGIVVVVWKGKAYRIQ